MEEAPKRWSANQPATRSGGEEVRDRAQVVARRVDRNTESGE